MKLPDSLIERLKEKDERAFGELMQKFSKPFLHLILSYFPNKAIAEDILQEAWLDIFNSIGNFEGKSKLYTWLTRVVINKCLMEKRKHNAQKRSVWANVFRVNDRFDYASNNFDHPGVSLEQQEDTKALYTALEKLSQEQRLVFTFYFLEDKTIKEIEDLLDKSKKAIESLLFRAKEKMKKELYWYYTNNYKR